jgi:ribosomal protein L25 (general stress protein Ctc)
VALKDEYSEFIKAYNEAGENTIISLDVDDKKIHF